MTLIRPLLLLALLLGCLAAVPACSNGGQRENDAMTQSPDPITSETTAPESTTSVAAEVGDPSASMSEQASDATADRDIRTATFALG